MKIYAWPVVLPRCFAYFIQQMHRDVLILPLVDGFQNLWVYTLKGIPAVLFYKPAPPPEITATTREPVRQITAAMLQPGNGMPTIYIEPMRVVGTPSERGISVDVLTEKIGDAFARFDTINVAYAPRSSSAEEPRSDYKLWGPLNTRSKAPASNSG